MLKLGFTMPDIMAMPIKVAVEYLGVDKDMRDPSTGKKYVVKRKRT